MNVTSEEIRAIKPGTIKPFLCESGNILFSVASLLSRMKRLGLPPGVVDYESQKFFEPHPIILIHAMKEGDEFVLNK